MTKTILSIWLSLLISFGANFSLALGSDELAAAPQLYSNDPKADNGAPLSGGTLAATAAESLQLTSAATATHGVLDAVRDLGLVPDDPAVDNGAILTAAIREGRVNGTVHFPGGAYYATSTASDCGKTGLAFSGQGLATWNVRGNFISSRGEPQREGNASVRWIYTGLPEQPAWRITGNGTRLVGINIWRGWEQAKPTWDGATAIEFDHPGRQNGQWSLDHLCICGFSVGMRFQGSNQCDSSDFGLIRIEDCERDIRLDNPQTTGLSFAHLTSVGAGESVFSGGGGGGVVVTLLELVGPKCVFDFTNTKSNNATYTVVALKADNAAAGWRLARHTGAGPLCLRVLSGEIGNKATPAADWIAVPARKGYKRLVEATLWPIGPTVVGGY